MSRSIRVLALVVAVTAAWAPAGWAETPAPPPPGVDQGVGVPGGLVEYLAGDADTNTRVGVGEGAGASQLAVTATFDVTYTAFSQQAQTAFQAALDIWATQVTSSVPIKIDAEYAPLGPGVLGSAGPTTIYRDFTSAPVASTFYPVALAEALQGANFNGTAFDITANFNSNFTSWYFGTDGQTPAGRYDFMSTVLHEVGHGLGFLGSMDVSGGMGEWGFGAPVFPIIYDRFTETTAGTLLLNPAAFPNPSTALGSALTSGGIFFDGPKADVPDGGTRPKLYAPGTWSGGSSYSHLDEGLYPPGTINSLMTPIGGTAEANHTPGPIALCMFEDMGWVTPESCAPPANNAFGASQAIAGTSGSVTGTIVGGTEEAGEPDHAGNAGGRSVWFSWTAPATGTATFDTVGSGLPTGTPLDTLLAVYTGGAVNALSVIGSNDDIDPGVVVASRVGPMPVNSGTTYRVAVDGFKESGLPPATGPVRLNWAIGGGGSEGPADFNGDGDTDASVFRPVSGNWFSQEGPSLTYGTNGDIPVPGDYDDDGKADFAVWRPATGTWFLRSSLNGSDTSITWGIPSDIPVPADYDGDGKTDVAVFRPASGAWYIRNSFDATLTTVTWGISGDIPVVGDYDGDGEADLAVWRPADGDWFVSRSTGGTISKNFGASGDIPLPGDYDGDTKTDVAVFRPPTGTWFVENSSTTLLTSLTYGISTDQPQPGDYDGDGTTDVAVWRPSTGTWFKRNSSNGSDTQVTWGISTDVPLAVPNAIRRFFY